MIVGEMKVVVDCYWRSTKKVDTAQLFNLTADPSELTDLAKTQPNDLQAVLARLDYWEQQSVEPCAPPSSPFPFTRPTCLRWLRPLRAADAVNGAERSCGNGKPQSGATAGAPAGSPPHCALSSPPPLPATPLAQSPRLSCAGRWPVAGDVWC